MLRTLAKAAQAAGRAQWQAGSRQLSDSLLLASDALTAGAGSGTFGLQSQAWTKCAAPLFSLRSLHTGVPSLAAQPQTLVKEEQNALPHKGSKGTGSVTNEEKTREKGYMMMYPHYDYEYLESIKPKHIPPEKLYQKTALWAVNAMRWGFDTLTGYPKNMTEAKWLQRILFLETVAGVPGMVGAMLRHMKSLRSMQRDYGWIHTLLEEAENERMHLLTFMQLKQPGPLFRGFVLLTQGVFFNLYLGFYLMSPRHCHAFVSYLEEQAVRTYTHALKEIDSGKLAGWSTKRPPDLAMQYWDLKEDATMRDLILAVRADEASHAHVNHTFSTLKQNEENPFERGAHHVP